MKTNKKKSRIFPGKTWRIKMKLTFKTLTLAAALAAGTLVAFADARGERHKCKVPYGCRR